MTINDLWGVVVGGGFTLLGAGISQFIEYFRRRAEDRRQLVNHLYEYRIRANENIINVLYDITDYVEEKVCSSDGSLKTLKAVNKEVQKCDIRIHEEISKNSLRADKPFLRAVGSFRTTLRSIPSLVERAKGNAGFNDLKKAVYTIQKSFDDLINVCRKNSGVEFLNENLQKAFDGEFNGFD